MKRTLSITLVVLAAVCLFRASNMLNTAHAQSDEHGPVIHRPNTDNGVANSVEDPGEPETGHGAPNRGDALTTGGTTATTPISYHGGALIQTPRSYVIWYGNWNQANGSDTPAGQQLVRDFLSNIGGSPYFQLNTSYSAGGYTITGNASYGGDTTDTGTSTRLSDTDIFTIVKNAINSGRLPYDASGVYFVITSSNVNERSGFCTRYCGWHTAGNNTSGARIRYSFIGNANRCLSSCAAQSTSPNGNAGVDGAISVIAHELEEAVTDPDPLSGWADASGAENADKCAWTFGHFQYQVANGSWANMHLGARDYLIQRNLQHNVSGDLCKVDATHN
jgi:hypothetical protein